jgi:hypothetical protein
MLFRSICVWLYSPLLDLAAFSTFLILYTVGRIPWTGDQPVARPILTHRTTQTQSAHTEIHALSWIRTQDPSVRGAKRVYVLNRAVTMIGSDNKV